MLRWAEEKPQELRLEEIGETYGRYRLHVPELERGMMRSLESYGQLSPIVVVMREGRWELIDGFKRLGAARKLQLDRLLARQIEQQLNSHVIGPWLDLGFFNWYTTSKPLNSYGDLKGLKIRNSGGAGQAWRTQFMGAIPNTTPLPNVALGLSQGTFDGLITSHETVASGQFWESGIRHGFEDHQFVAEYIPLVSRTFWQKLSPDLQQLLTDHWRDNISAYRASMAAAQARARENLQAHGIKIAVPSAEELAATRQEMMAKQEQAAKLSKISPEMLAALSAVIAAAG